MTTTTTTRLPQDDPPAHETKIIVGVDGSERSLDAVAFASALAPYGSATLVLVGAFAGAEAALARIAGTLSVAVETRAVGDPWPARALHRVASAEDAPLIVIGSGHPSAEQLLSGSTAGRVVRHSPCAVAVVPAGHRLSVARAIDRVGCAFDGSPEADAALAAAVEAAQALHAELEVVWALAAETVLEHAAAEQFGRALAAASTRVRAKPVLAPGAPASVLAARSERLDLLFAGSRGYGPRRSVLWGSVTARLLRSAACPVVVVPRGAEPTLGRLFAPAAAVRAA